MEMFQGKDAWVMFLLAGFAMGLAALGVWLKSEVKAFFVKLGIKFGDDPNGPDGKI